METLKMKLMGLATDPTDPMVETVAKRLGVPGRKEPGEQLRNFIMTMPDMIAQIRVWAGRGEVPARIRRLHGFLLTYLYHPFDLVSDEQGLLGYLDDAYLVGRVYVLSMPPSEPGKPLDNQDLAPQLVGWLGLAERVIPAATKEIEKMLGELITDKTDAFEEILKRNPPETSDKTLRAEQKSA